MHWSGSSYLLSLLILLILLETTLTDTPSAASSRQKLPGEGGKGVGEIVGQKGEEDNRGWDFLSDQP